MARTLKTLPVEATKEAIGRLRLANRRHDATLASEHMTLEQLQNSHRCVEECRRALHNLLWDVVAPKDRRHITDLISAIEA